MNGDNSSVVKHRINIQIGDGSIDDEVADVIERSGAADIIRATIDLDIECGAGLVVDGCHSVGEVEIVGHPGRSPGVIPNSARDVQYRQLRR